MDYNKDAFPSQGSQLGPLEEVQEIHTGKFGSTLGTGPARARVRGRDSRCVKAAPLLLFPYSRGREWLLYGHLPVSECKQ